MEKSGDKNREMRKNKPSEVALDINMFFISGKEVAE